MAPGEGSALRGEKIFTAISTQMFRSWNYLSISRESLRKTDRNSLTIVFNDFNR